MSRRRGFGSTLIARIALEHPGRPPREVLAEFLAQKKTIAGVARALGEARPCVRAALDAFSLREAAPVGSEAHAEATRAGLAAKRGEADALASVAADLRFQGLAGVADELLSGADPAKLAGAVEAMATRDTERSIAGALRRLPSSAGISQETEKRYCRAQGCPVEMGPDLRRFAFLSGYAPRTDEEQEEVLALAARLRAGGCDPGWPIVERAAVGAAHRNEREAVREQIDADAVHRWDEEIDSLAESSAAPEAIGAPLDVSVLGARKTATATAFGVTREVQLCDPCAAQKTGAGGQIRLCPVCQERMREMLARPWAFLPDADKDRRVRVKRGAAR